MTSADESVNLSFNKRFDYGTWKPGATSVMANTIDDRGPPLKCVTITLLALAVISFSMRAYVRTRMTKSFGLDDWFMTGATAVYIFYSACVLCGIKYGTGRKFENLTLSDVERALQVLDACIVT